MLKNLLLKFVVADSPVSQEVLVNNGSVFCHGHSSWCLVTQSRYTCIAK